MFEADYLYIKRSDLEGMTSDLALSSVKNIYYEGSFKKDFKESYLDGNDLVVLTNVNEYRIYTWN